MPYEAATASILGTREEQQDYALLEQGRSCIFAVVCDGMGGLEAGAAASKAAAETLRDLLAAKQPGEPVASFFLRCVDILDESVVRLGSGAGTTIVAAIIIGLDLFWLSIGDSRLYLLRGDEIVQATRDHNYYLLQPDAESGKGEALVSYLGLGGIEMMDINQTPFQLQPGDVVLLTTDGLTKSLPDHLILRLLRSGSTKESLQKLLEAATENSAAQDNTTCVVIQIKGLKNAV